MRPHSMSATDKKKTKKKKLFYAILNVRCQTKDTYHSIFHPSAALLRPPHRHKKKIQAIQEEANDENHTTINDASCRVFRLGKKMAASSLGQKQEICRGDEAFEN